MKTLAPLLTAMLITTGLFTGCGGRGFGASNSSGDFCNRLKTIVASAPDLFQSIKMHQYGSDEWEPAVLLPDMQECSIHKLIETTQYYSCVAYEGTDQQQVAIDLTNRIQSCMGDEWAYRTRQLKGGPTVTFKNPANKTTIELRIRRRSGGDIYQISLDVNND